MRGLFYVCSVFLCTILLLPGGAAAAEKTYKIGYLEGGQYWAYDETFKAVKQGIEKKGWGDKIEFPADARFSPGWDKEKEPMYAQRAKELMARDDLDLIIGMGTAATAALLKENNKKTPVVSMAISDAIKSGFVLSEKDSGVDNFTVRIVPERWKVMFELFHDIVQFKNLGVMYSDNESGRTYTNLEDAREVASERGFTLLEYPKISTSETVNDCKAGVKDLIKQGMDAFFIPALNCFDWTMSDTKSVMDVLIENKIPTFAREGSKMVKSGALMGLSTLDYTPAGDFLSDKIIRILKGEKPRALPMVDMVGTKISVNLETAEKIGIDLPMDILLASDETYETIELPADRLVK